jgi:phage shock protein PspC (stress-responsive transcriptional regulator)
MEQSRPDRLTRSRDRILGGVAAGLAEYFGIDPTIVRVLWVLAVVFGLPLAVLGYFILWVIMPAPDDRRISEAATHKSRAEARASRDRRDNGALILGIVLIIVGAVFLLPDRHLLPWFGFRLIHFAWPIVLILVGLLLLTRSSRADS